MKKTKRRFHPLTLLFIAVVVYFLVISSTRTIENFRLARNGKIVKAIVTNTKKVGGKGTIAVTFKYVVDGEEFSMTISNEPYQVGDSVSLLYLENSPQTSRTYRFISENYSTEIQPIIIVLNKSNYIKSTDEATAITYKKIDNFISPEDRLLICDELKKQSVGFLAADFVINVNKSRIDSMYLNGILTFNSDDLPLKDTSSLLNDRVFKVLSMALDSTNKPDGSYNFRIQLEKLCNNGRKN